MKLLGTAAHKEELKSRDNAAPIIIYAVCILFDEAMYPLQSTAESHFQIPTLKAKKYRWEGPATGDWEFDSDDFETVEGSTLYAV